MTVSVCVSVREDRVSLCYVQFRSFSWVLVLKLAIFSMYETSIQMAVVRDRIYAMKLALQLSFHLFFVSFKPLIRPHRRSL